jgi:hypothetical protein
MLGQSVAHIDAQVKNWPRLVMRLLAIAGNGQTTNTNTTNIAYPGVRI